ncbi:hypothetical protein OPV22_033061 [Ensete ventricosum]|uniref:Uncharacterized protein n=2 Tax=Ensete ventricosum TaxID=4639 RepID=A0AAV8P1V9_ENSVE|nr:hypothetical protein OPV22_033061 [Ensete ventricosum]
MASNQIKTAAHARGAVRKYMEAPAVNYSSLLSCQMNTSPPFLGKNEHCAIMKTRTFHVAIIRFILYHPLNDGFRHRNWRNHGKDASLQDDQS